MMLFFLVGVSILLGLLILSLFFKKYPQIQSVAIACCAAVTFFAFFGLIFQKTLAEKVEFLYPAAWILLGAVVAIPLILHLGAKWFSRRIFYPLTHLKVKQTSLRALFTRFVPLSCYMLALLLMVLALARPMQIDRTVLPPTEGIDIILLMDVSASMQQQDFYPNRFIAAQQTATRFISQRISDRIGLVVFAKVAMLQAPLTLDHESLQQYIQMLYLGMIDPNYTAIGDALGVATSHLKDSKAKSKIIILLTDGSSNAGTIDPVLAAKAAAQYGIRVYTVGTASSPQKNPYSNKEDEINEGLMMEIAQLTGGKFYRAENEAELKEIYDTINELEKTKFSPSSSVSRTDIYPPFLLLAVLCVLLGFVLEKLFLIKVP